MSRFLRTSLLLRALSISALLMAQWVHSQVAAAGQGVPSQTVIDILHQLSDKADVVFAGQVLAIRHPNDGVVEIEFRVDQAIRGCTAGTSYVLREWAGLWPGDNQRYRVGQRLLMLLHSPSAAGLSSPVGGMDGAIPIRQGGAVIAPDGDAATPSQPPYVDLRWLGARLPHAVSYRNEPVVAAKPTNLETPSFGQLRSVGATRPLGSAGGSDASVPAQQASVNAVIDMLSSWQDSQNVQNSRKAQHAAP